MSLSAHLQELKKKHQQLDAAVDAITLRPWFCNLEIRDMKKKKLDLKTKIMRLSKN